MMRLTIENNNKIEKSKSWTEFEPGTLITPKWNIGQNSNTNQIWLVGRNAYSNDKCLILLDNVTNETVVYSEISEADFIELPYKVILEN